MVHEMLGYWQQTVAKIKKRMRTSNSWNEIMLLDEYLQQADKELAAWEEAL